MSVGPSELGPGTTKLLFLKPKEGQEAEMILRSCRLLVAVRRPYVDARGTRPISVDASKLISLGQTKPERLKTLPHRDNRYQDSFFVAEKALKLLQNNDEEAVYDLIKKNHSTELTVTWNYLIRHKVEHGRLNAAFRDFQQMKKRAHFPDSYTYSTLFKGLSEHYEKGGRDKLPTLVDTLLNDKRVQVLTIHLNAALRTCRAQDVEYAYELMETMGDREHVVPDAVTYTCLFHLTRIAIEKEAGGGRRDLKLLLSETNQRYILNARRIWTEVRAAWLDGKFVIDARFLAEYVKLLMLGSADDRDQALIAIIEICNLPSPDHSSLTPLNTNHLSNTIRLDESLLLLLLTLCTTANYVQLMDFYWTQAKIAVAGHLTVPMYIARLHAIRAKQDPEAAAQVLEEMSREGLDVAGDPLDLALACQFAQRDAKLSTIHSFMRRFMCVETSPDTRSDTCTGIEESSNTGTDLLDARLCTVPIIATLSRALVRIKDTTPDRHDTLTILMLLATLDWRTIKAGTGTSPHLRVRFGDAVRQVLGKSKKQREVLRVSKRERGRAALAKCEALKSFEARLKEVAGPRAVAPYHHQQQQPQQQPYRHDRVAKKSRSAKPDASDISHRAGPGTHRGNLPIPQKLDTARESVRRA